MSATASGSSRTGAVGDAPSEQTTKPIWPDGYVGMVV